jgi:hypothetical protein
MPEQLELDQLSEQIDGQLRAAKILLSETERILAEETTSEHRDKWPNVYRLENATKRAQIALTWVDPRITRENVATDLVNVATEGRDAIRAAVDSGGGNLIKAAEGLLTVTAQLEPRRFPSEEEAKATAVRLDEALTRVDEEKSSVISAIQTARQEIDAQREDLTTRGQSLSRLIDDLTNASSLSYFEDQAEKYEKESRRFWIAGVVVLGAAACIAILPVVLSYLLSNHKLSGQSNISAHLGATLAFAAVAGVLLARARSRDRDRQRNRDLSVALGTMFAYSEQIANQEEKERFKHDMGRLVLETFLEQKPPSEDASRSVLRDVTDAGVGPSGESGS